MKKILKYGGFAILALALVAIIAFFIYVSDYEKATEPALVAMVSTDEVEVETSDDYIVYRPKGDVEAGFIFYPGGKVEPTVYSRVFHQLAESGIQTVVVKMPFNLAMFNINGAEAVFKLYPDMDQWYMGGHSLGGVFSTEYFKNHAEKFQGLIYMASYPSSDISDIEMKVLSLTGSLDTVLNRTQYEEAKEKLPTDTVYYEIVGGNHTQFGDYSLQKGDTEATISAEEQHDEIITQILRFMMGEKH